MIATIYIQLKLTRGVPDLFASSFFFHVTSGQRKRKIVGDSANFIAYKCALEYFLGMKLRHGFHVVKFYQFT